MHPKRRLQRPLQPSTKTNLAFLLVAVLILLIAAFMQITRIDGVPPGPFCDDAANGIIAQSIAYGNSHPAFTLAFTGREPLYHYITAILMQLIGNDLWALRLASFYLGVIIIAGIIVIAKEFFTISPAVYSCHC